MKTGFGNRKRLPLVMEPDDARGRSGESHAEICLRHGDSLRDKLLENGVLLLRGFAAPAVNEFARFVRQFSGREPLDYVGGASPRVKLGGGVYTSTEYAPHVTLSLHNELSYTYRWPALLFFFCAVAKASRTPRARASKPG
jgi:Taurine catabolism dioxygenase TauD, TfdA family